MKLHYFNRLIISLGKFTPLYFCSFLQCVSKTHFFSVSALHIYLHGVYPHITSFEWQETKGGDLTGQTQSLDLSTASCVQVLFSSTLKYIHNNILPKIFVPSIIMVSSP